MSRRTTLNSPKIFFVADNTEIGGGSTHVGSSGCYEWPWREHTMPIAVIAGTEHSDYSGSVRERSNCRVLLADDRISPYVIPLIGSYGYAAVAYPAYLGPVPLCEPLAELMQGLADGEPLDDQDVDRLEMELEGEAWEASGRRDFRKALTKLLDELDAGMEHDLEDYAIDIVWHAGCQAYGINGGNGYTIETGPAVYFHIDEWCRRAKVRPSGASVHAARHGIAEVPSLTELSVLTRVTG